MRGALLMEIRAGRGRSSGRIASLRGTSRANLIWLLACVFFNDRQVVVIWGDCFFLRCVVALPLCVLCGGLLRPFDVAL